MRNMLIAVFLMATSVSCGRQSEKKGAARPLPAACRQILARHQHCLDALVVVARERGSDLLVRSMTNLSPQERGKLQSRLTARLRQDGADFRKLLARSVRDEFPSWCASAAASNKGRTLVSAMKSCLGKPDCQTYAACIGGILSGLLPPAASESSAPATATDSGDATGTGKQGSDSPSRSGEPAGDARPSSASRIAPGNRAARAAARKKDAR